MNLKRENIKLNIPYTLMKRCTNAKIKKIAHLGG